jgi:malate dehydrogenase (oxaloacetate-decarboxylating)(NADP+)
VLQAVQIVADEGIAKPILIGREAVVERRIEKLGLRIRQGVDFELCDPEDDPRYRDYWTEYHGIMERNGVTPSKARTVVRTNNTVIAALMVRRGEADAMLAGPLGAYTDHLDHLCDVIGLRDGVGSSAALQMVVLDRGIYFFADTHVTLKPSVDEIAETTVLAAEEVRRFGIEPKVALLSHSTFGNSHAPAAKRMRKALEAVRALAPDLEVEGEMNAAVALNEAIRNEMFPNSRLSGEANLLIMPTLDSANIAFNLVKQLANGIAVGPMLLGMAKPAHILNATITVRGTVNMSGLAVIDAQVHANGERDQVDAASGGD